MSDTGLDLIELINYKLSTENDLDHLIKTISLALQERLDPKEFQIIIEDCASIHNSHRQI